MKDFILILRFITWLLAFALSYYHLRQGKHLQAIYWLIFSAASQSGF